MLNDFYCVKLIYINVLWVFTKKPQGLDGNVDNSDAFRKYRLH